MKDIKGNLLKHGDKVFNKNVNKEGIILYDPKKDWWFFYADYPNGKVGVPENLASNSENGIVKLL